MNSAASRNTLFMKQALNTYFVSELLHTIQDEGAPEVYTTEIILKDQVLVSIIAPSRIGDDKSTDQSKFQLIPGENTVLSEDGNALIALVTGYPFMERNQNDHSLSVQVNMIPLVHVSADNMQALLTLYPALTNKPSLQPETLETILKGEGINFGIDKSILTENVEKLATLKNPINNIPIARGMLPIDGKDAYLLFELEIGPIPGKILRDGTIDFRERKIFTGVDVNQVIAIRVPETNGTPGKNIFGEAIPQQPGNDITVKISGDVSYSPENGQVIATRSGVLSIVKDSDIQVSAKQTIPGDVDLSVGNIESKDCVEIKGNVSPGFSVKTKGDLLVDGNIEGATIVSKGNVVVKGGLLGESSRLETLGDADINFTERAEIIAGGGIIIRKGAYYSRVTGDSSILCSPGSKIIGCVFCCAGNFEGGNVGSHQGKPATIAAGVDGKRYNKYKKLKQQVLDIEEKLETLRDREEAKSIVDKIYRQYEDELQQLQSALRKLNLIPKTPVDSRNEPAFNSTDAQITIHGTAATGTILRIGNLTKTLEDECSAVVFFIDCDRGVMVVKNL